VKFLTLVRFAFGLAAASLLVSCGGGGAASKPIDSGTFAVNPPTATWYAGVKNTLQFAGGKPPFRLTSSEPGLMPLPDVVNGLSLDVVPNQPGVVDAGLAPGELQVRTVNVVARSAEGFTATAVDQGRGELPYWLQRVHDFHDLLGCRDLRGRREHDRIR
jgi:hypothetical protein